MTIASMDEFTGKTGEHRDI